MQRLRAKSRVKRWRLLLSVELSVLAVFFWFTDHRVSRMRTTPPQSPDDISGRLVPCEVQRRSDQHERRMAQEVCVSSVGFFSLVVEPQCYGGESVVQHSALRRGACDHSE
jgi:hypothetical protein